MSGYAVSARISGAPVHAVTGNHRGDATGMPSGIVGAEPARPDEPAAQLEPEPPDGFAAILSDLREAWAQTTFYLFDGDGWR